MGTPAASHTTFNVLSGQSAVLVKARSNVGPISFATTEITGMFSTINQNRAFDIDFEFKSQLQIQVDTLVSGNRLYDAEIRRRIDARRYPIASIELRSATRIGDTGRYELTGEIEFHDVTRSIAGTVSAAFRDPSTMVIRGEQVFEVQDFNLAVPATLMLKIFPAVRVDMHLEAHAV
jgi:polyisoprenoid-binding protein YceI